MIHAEDADAAGRGRRRRPASEKLKIVRLTLEPGASVAEVARKHGVNANQVFKWRRLFDRGQLFDAPRNRDPGEDYGIRVFLDRAMQKSLASRGHPILLGETDAFSEPPQLDGDFKVKCDVCGKECSYSSRDLLRFEAIAPESFPTHPLFEGAA